MSCEGFGSPPWVSLKLPMVFWTTIKTYVEKVLWTIQRGKHNFYKKNDLISGKIALWMTHDLEEHSCNWKLFRQSFNWKIKNQTQCQTKPFIIPIFWHSSCESINIFNFIINQLQIFPIFLEVEWKTRFSEVSRLTKNKIII